MRADLSACIVFTAEVMKFFYRRDREGGDADLQEQPQNAVGGEDHRVEKETWFGCFGESLRQLNMILISAVALGC